MILGVSLRMLPSLFGVPATPARRAWVCLGLLIAAVLGEVGGFLAYRWTGDARVAASLLVAWVVLALAIAGVVLPWKLWRPLPIADPRSGKFVQAAYVWLAVSVLMLLAFPAYQRATGIAFSHAYYGAIRHAITVGFISLMIMGFAARVVPTLTGADTVSLTRLWGPFVLINTGCLLRVLFQTLTDWSSLPYAVIGLSGTLEVIALAWWGGGLVRLLVRSRAAEAQAVAARTSAAPAQIEARHRPAEVLAWFPETAEVFDRFGFTPLRQPALRATLGRSVTLAQASRMHGVAVDELVGALNLARALGMSQDTSLAEDILQSWRGVGSRGMG
jgi:hypothetical protein